MNKAGKFLDKVVYTVVPHKKHGNIPHLLQKEFLVLIAIFSFALFYFNFNNSLIIKGLNLTSTVYPAVLADLTNQERATVGASGLTWNDTLVKAAGLKAADMMKNNYFAHNSPTGLTPWYWFTQVHYNFIYAGENLAIGYDQSNDVEDAWLNSPTHKANIVNNNFSEIGIVAVDGQIQGSDTTLVVELFGKPLVAEAETTFPVPTPKTPAVNSTPVIPPKPVVKGTSTESVVVATPPATPPIKVIEQADKPANKFISVQNTDVTPAPTVVNTSTDKSFSTWYERFIVSPTNTIKIIYDVFLSLIVLAIVLMLFRAYEKHHGKHVFMGTALIAFIGILLYFI